LREMFWRVGNNSSGRLMTRLLTLGSLALCVVVLAFLCGSAMAQENTSDYWYKKGLELDGAGSYSEALDAFDRVIQMDSKNVSAWLDKANVYISLALITNEGLDEAVEAFDKAIEIDPRYAEAWYEKGDLLLYMALTKNRSEIYNESLACFEKAIEIDPMHAMAWTGKGSVLLSQQKHEDAIAALDRAIDINPTNKEAWNKRGNALADLHRYDESIEAFDQAIEHTSANSTNELAAIWFQKSKVLLMAGRAIEAADSFNTTLQLDPKNTFSWTITKGEFLESIRDHEGALREYESAIKQASTQLSKAWQKKGHALKALDRQADSEAALARAKELWDTAQSYHE